MSFIKDQELPWLQDNKIEMYSTHNEGKLVVAERLTRTLKNENYKHMAVVLKNIYTDKLDDIFWNLKWSSPM